jgi:transcriptional antiterminator NusG
VAGGPTEAAVPSTREDQRGSQPPLPAVAVVETPAAMPAGDESKPASAEESLVPRPTHEPPAPVVPAPQAVEPAQSAPDIPPPAEAKSAKQPGAKPETAGPASARPVAGPAGKQRPASAAAPAEKAAGASRKTKKKPVPLPVSDEPKSENMQWYILKVQSNREESIREGLLRRVAIAGLGSFFGEVIVPTEKVTEFRGGKRKVTKRKLYPGYLVVQMEINQETWFLVRETPGIGDFTGASGHPTPMLPHEVSRIIARKDEKTDEQPKLDIKFHAGDRVKINEGTFENFEGEVETIDQTTGRVTVMINIFGRSTPVELGYWQIESV